MYTLFKGAAWQIHLSFILYVDPGSIFGRRVLVPKIRWVEDLMRRRSPRTSGGLPRQEVAEFVLACRKLFRIFWARHQATGKDFGEDFERIIRNR